MKLKISQDAWKGGSELLRSGNKFTITKVINYLPWDSLIARNPPEVLNLIVFFTCSS